MLGGLSWIISVLPFFIQAASFSFLTLVILEFGELLVTLISLGVGLDIILAVWGVLVVVDNQEWLYDDTVLIIGYLFTGTVLEVWGIDDS